MLVLLQIVSIFILSHFDSPSLGFIGLFQIFQQFRFLDFVYNGHEADRAAFRPGRADG
jgi:hypothetical protein